MELERFRETAANMTVAALEASVLGSLSGTALWTLGRFAAEEVALGWEVMLLPVAIALMAFFAWWVIFPAVLVFGIPLFIALRRWANCAWMTPAAVFAGGLAGGVAGQWLSADLEYLGATCGAASGFFWCYSVRRWIVRSNQITMGIPT